jgi:hypothetical protein
MTKKDTGQTNARPFATSYAIYVSLHLIQAKQSQAKQN